MQKEKITRSRIKDDFLNKYSKHVRVTLILHTVVLLIVVVPVVIFGIKIVTAYPRMRDSMLPIFYSTVFFEIMLMIATIIPIGQLCVCIKNRHIIKNGKFDVVTDVLIEKIMLQKQCYFICFLIFVVCRQFFVTIE